MIYPNIININNKLFYILIDQFYYITKDLNNLGKPYLFNGILNNNPLNYKSVYNQEKINNNITQITNHWGLNIYYEQNISYFNYNNYQIPLDYKSYYTYDNSQIQIKNLNYRIKIPLFLWKDTWFLLNSWKLFPHIFIYDAPLHIGIIVDHCGYETQNMPVVQDNILYPPNYYWLYEKEYINLIFQGTQDYTYDLELLYWFKKSNYFISYLKNKKEYIYISFNENTLKNLASDDLFIYVNCDIQ